MANIQRAVLVESPPEAAYRLWKDMASYPAFFEGVSRVEPIDADRFRWHSNLDGDNASWTLSLTQDVPGRRLAWRNSGGRQRECLLTFAPLEGNACWMVFNVEFDTEGVETDLADLLASAERRLQRILVNAREMIETAYREDPQGCETSH